jgi:hypothetical protein
MEYVFVLKTEIHNGEGGSSRTPRNLHSDDPNHGFHVSIILMLYMFQKLLKAAIPGGSLAEKVNISTL